jgi:acyl-CoA thioesterase FadM
MISTEHIVGTRPLVVRRRVKWGDCDPAGVVYTVMFAEYVISAAELFYGSLFETTPQRAKNLHGFGTPSRALTFDFRSSLRPDDEFDITVMVDDIRTRSYVLGMDARTIDGIDVFRSVLTPICVARHERRAIPIPPPFRTALEQYRADCAARATRLRPLARTN